MENALNNTIEKINTSFGNLIEELEGLDDSSAENILNSKERTKEILKNINTTLKDNISPINYLPLSDLEHRLRGKLDVYRRAQSFLEKDSTKEEISEVTTAKENLLDILKTYKDLDTGIIGLISIDKIQQIIDKRINRGRLEIRVTNKTTKNFEAQCSERIIESIIYELLVNYEKYGKDGILDLDIKDDSFILNLSNSKKPKENAYSSNNGLNILKQYLNEIWGEIDYDYSHDECTTTVTIPVKIKEK